MSALQAELHTLDDSKLLHTKEISKKSTTESSYLMNIHEYYVPHGDCWGFDNWLIKDTLTSFGPPVCIHKLFS